MFAQIALWALLSFVLAYILGIEIKQTCQSAKDLDVVYWCFGARLYKGYNEARDLGKSCKERRRRVVLIHYLGKPQGADLDTLNVLWLTI
ncbi:hypothetical protein IPA_01220 [Ignicoccus pacificus DSM 13166]|uniref:Uncharacterized protein n=1 Tax=Ignicoccus pacificus DSM 13166 TaxID=940294 RepID=A0A977KAG6_9CREN|nr:hypothetical protein IPA_01220 [Ignicoccus pacificus DSM 13166]